MVVLTPLKDISQLGLYSQYMDNGKAKTCSKPPTSLVCVCICALFRNNLSRYRSDDYNKALDGPSLKPTGSSQGDNPETIGNTQFL